MLIMGDGIGVIVGTGIGGQTDILLALLKGGYPAKSVGQMWPRDHYVHLDGRYVISGSPGSVHGNAFVEVGNILAGNGFLLVSDFAYTHEASRESKLCSDSRGHHGGREGIPPPCPHPRCSNRNVPWRKGPWPYRYVRTLATNKETSFAGHLLRKRRRQSGGIRFNRRGRRIESETPRTNVRCLSSLAFWT